MQVWFETKTFSLVSYPSLRDFGWPLLSVIMDNSAANTLRSDLNPGH